MQGKDFKKLFDRVNLYVECNDGDTYGVTIIVVSDDMQYGASISFCDAVQIKTASFLFGEKNPIDIKDIEEAESIRDNCIKLLSENKTSRGVIWLNKDEAYVMALREDFSSLKRTFEAPISGTFKKGIEVSIKNGALIDIYEKSLCLTNPLDFSFGNTNIGNAMSVSLALCGDMAGTLFVDMNVSARDFTSLFKCGFEYGYYGSNKEFYLISNYLFSDNCLDSADLNVSFEFGFWVLHTNRMWIDILANDKHIQSNSESKSGVNSKINPKRSFKTNFKTLYGDDVYFSVLADTNKKSGMEFLHRISDNVNCTPLGTYKIYIEREKDIKLLCGFSGTEYILLENGAEVYFKAGKPAFSSYYPEKEFSIDDFVNKNSKDLLTDEFTTAWAGFNGKYYTQPFKSPFFTGTDSVLKLADLYIDFTDMDCPPLLPIMPYNGLRVNMYGNMKDSMWVSADDAASFDNVVLAKERSRFAGFELNKLIRENKDKITDNVKTVTAATPSGFIGDVTDNVLAGVKLAFSDRGNLEFSNISDEIRNAFLDSSLFCVIANSDKIGKFDNQFSIEDWNFKLSIGSGSKYNEYANVLLIKSVNGRIYNPDNVSESLCANIGAWTGRDSFSKPLEGDIPNLENWLINYCKKSIEDRNDNAYLEKFAEIITDENWKGILALNTTLMSECFPDCLKPLLAGLSEDSEICAHHIGADIISVKSTENGPVPMGNSPFFGLIQYKAAGYYGMAMPIDDAEEDYEFKLLEMNVLFEKGKTKDFKSVSQFVLRKFMLKKASAKGCLYNALLLNGSLQNRSGHSYLTMNSEGGDFYFDDSVIEKVEISGVVMESVNPEKEEYAFNLSGGIRFLEAESKDVADVYSYNLLLFFDYRISFENGIFTLDLSKLNFNLSKSESRDNSMCKSFGMIPVKAVAGNNIIDGYKAISVEGLKVNTKLDDTAAGMIFDVRLGALGGLSSGSVLDSKVIIAWNDSGVFIGLKLPGACIIDDVFGLTFGDARLVIKEGKPVIFISKMSLQLLGLLKFPANGACSLALAGADKGIGWFAAYEK